MDDIASDSINTSSFTVYDVQFWNMEGRWEVKGTDLQSLDDAIVLGKLLSDVYRKVRVVQVETTRELTTAWEFNA